jgi:hypothetical protein
MHTYTAGFKQPGTNDLLWIEVIAKSTNEARREMYRVLKQVHKIPLYTGICVAGIFKLHT